MNNTENNVAEQAGDEPMRAAAAVIKLCQEWCVAMYQHAANIGAGGPGIEAALDAKAESTKAAIRSLAVSPRATADVERDAARYRWLRDEANNNPRRAPMVFNVAPATEIYWTDALYGDRLDAALDIFIATTKPGA